MPSEIVHNILNHLFNLSDKRPLWGILFKTSIKKNTFIHMVLVRFKIEYL